MNNVNLLHIKCCFFQFFNSPVALKNVKKNLASQEKVEMTSLEILYTTSHILWYSDKPIAIQLPAGVVLWLATKILIPVEVVLCNLSENTREYEKWFLIGLVISLKEDRISGY